MWVSIKLSLSVILTLAIAACGGGGAGGPVIGNVTPIALPPVDQSVAEVNFGTPVDIGAYWSPTPFALAQLNDNSFIVANLLENNNSNLNSTVTFSNLTSSGNLITDTHFVGRVRLPSIQSNGIDVTIAAWNEYLPIEGKDWRPIQIREVSSSGHFTAPLLLSGSTYGLVNSYSLKIAENGDAALLWTESILAYNPHRELLGDALFISTKKKSSNWTTPIRLSTLAPENASISLSGNGNLLVAWSEYDFGAVSKTRLYSRSMNSFGTWSGRYTINTAPEDTSANVGGISTLALNDGSAVIAWNRIIDDQNSSLVYSLFAPVSLWSAVDIFSIGGYAPMVLTSSRDGAIDALWSNLSANGSGLGLYHIGVSNTTTVSNLTVLTGRDFKYQYWGNPTAVADKSGNLFAVWSEVVGGGAVGSYRMLRAGRYTSSRGWYNVGRLSPEGDSPSRSIAFPPTVSNIVNGRLGLIWPQGDLQGGTARSYFLVANMASN